MSRKQIKFALDRALNLSFKCPRCNSLFEERVTSIDYFSSNNTVNGSVPMGMDIDLGGIGDFSEVETGKMVRKCGCCDLQFEFELEREVSVNHYFELSTDYEGEILTPEEIQELRYAEARKRELDSRVNLFSAK